MLTKNILITGTSTGIGRACVLHLAARGWRVFAGVRKPADGNALVAAAGGNANIVPVQVDVTDDASIRAAAGSITQAVGIDGLASVVNNAGIGVVGPVEFVSLADWRMQFEVNVFGAIAITQACLPLLRKHVAASGVGSARIVNISSIAGRMAQPILGPYTASKFALESVSDSLRLELRAQGIKVCLVEPGAIQSEIWGKGQAQSALVPPDSPARKLYGREIDAVTKLAASTAAGAIPAARVARVVEACLTKPRPRARYVVGRDAKVAAAAKLLLPTPVLDAVLARAYRLPAPGSTPVA